MRRSRSPKARAARTLWWIALACVAADFGAGRASAEPPSIVALDAPGAVWGLRLTDGLDGRKDLWMVSGRDVHHWHASKVGTFPSAPTSVFHVPEGATFAAPGRYVGEGAERTPTLLALARSQALRVVAGRGTAVEEGLVVDMPWNDSQRVVLADFAPGKSLFLPTAQGVRFVPDWIAAPTQSVELPLRPVHTVAAAGPFVEDGATTRVSWPRPTWVAAWPEAGGRPAVFWIGSDGIHAFAKGADGAWADRIWSTAFLSRDGSRSDTLIDLDADGTPDLAHVTTTNDDGSYVFFRTPVGAPAKPGEAADLRPARGSIHLTGFQLPVEYPDLDGDGRPDLVVTTIDIDGSNVARAVMQRRVKAKTHAFVNRGAAGGDFFIPRPDAIVESEIGVQILFSYSGSIDVKRSFTIVTTADLDGDKRKDLVIRTGSDVLSVYRGVATGVWSPEATSTISIPAIGKSPDIEGSAGDLTGDGHDDLVLLYRAPPGGADRTVVVVSK